MTDRRRANVRCRGWRAVLRAALATLLGLFAAADMAADVAAASPRIASLAVGVAGAYRSDRWCPVEVRVADVEADAELALEITARDSTGRFVTYRSSERLLAKAENRIAQLVRLGEVGESNATIVVTLRDAGGDVVDRRGFVLADLAERLGDKSLDDESLVPIVGRLSGLDAVEYPPPNENRRAVYRQLASLARLPAVGWRSLTDRTLALDAVDTVVWLAGQTPDRTPERTPVQAPDAFDDERDRRSVELLDDWVRGGGRLILSLGPHAAQSKNVTSALQRMNVAIQSESAELRRIAPLEAFVGDAAISRGRSSAGRSEAPPFRLPIVQLAAGDGMVVAAAGQSADALPLVLRVPHGFGEIVVVAFDLGDEALVAWPAHARLLSKVFALGESDPSATPTQRPSSAAWTGKAYESLGQQLADALDRFPGASPSRFWYLAAAALAYILVIGPLDWYIVRRKPEWTWATFLTTVVLAAVGVYAIVNATKTDAPLVNRLGFVDVDLTAADSMPPHDRLSDARSAARIRESAWTCLYQPTAALVDVGVGPPAFARRIAADEAAPPTASPHPRLFLWDRPTAIAASGLANGFVPERSANDRTPRADGTPRANANLAYDAAGNISSLARPAWSSQHVIGNRTHDATLASVAALTPDAFGRVVGQIRNPLDEPLKQSVLFYGTFALSLGTLAPGQSVDVDGRGDWRSTEAYLTRRRLNEDRETAQRYDPTNFDLDRIGEVIGLYEAAGGKPYVGLDRRNLERLDLTGQLRLGRAILIGKAQSGVRVSISRSNATDSQPADSNRTATGHLQSTWWRFLIRVAAPGAPAR